MEKLDWILLYESLDGMLDRNVLMHSFGVSLISLISDFIIVYSCILT